VCVCEKVCVCAVRRGERRTEGDRREQETRQEEESVRQVRAGSRRGGGCAGSEAWQQPHRLPAHTVLPLPVSPVPVSCLLFPVCPSCAQCVAVQQGGVMSESGVAQGLGVYREEAEKFSP